MPPKPARALRDAPAGGLPEVFHMKTATMDDALRQKVVDALSQAPLFAGLDAAQIAQVVSHAELVQFDPEETMVRQGDPSDALYLLLSGEASVRLATADQASEISRIRPPETFGELGLLIEHERTANVVAISKSVAARFGKDAFLRMFSGIPSFGLATARELAVRLARANLLMPLPAHEDADGMPDPAIVGLVPIQFIERHRVVPLAVHGSTLKLGCVGDPGTNVLMGVRGFLPSMDVRPVRISTEFYDNVMRTRAGVSLLHQEPEPVKVLPRSPALDKLLERVVAEGASDLHLSAGRPPYWRVDGELRPLEDAPALGATEAGDLLTPVMTDEQRREYADSFDCDFAYSVPGLGRFRVNLFHDHLGTGAALRLIPDAVLSFEQLNLPPQIAALCAMPSGLILVSGPTGSGKSTTIAAMVDYINRARRGHVITLEDPIEFVYRNSVALVNQREIGIHAKTFASGVRAALREDPDVIVVGEMRDAETTALTLEAASTGHLVLATSHTTTAATTVDHVISVFRSTEQEHARVLLAESLRGVVCQTLCRKIGGGRIAALELLFVNHAIQTMLRETKTHHIENAMVTSRKDGNILLNDSLEKLVTSHRVAREEAMSKAVDKTDLAKRLAHALEAGVLSAGQPGPRPHA
jgi:twitching motility protein PilT